MAKTPYFTNHKDQYGLVHRMIHWITALAIFFLLASGLFSLYLPGISRPEWISLHKTCGLTVLVLTLLRIIWRYSNTLPSLPRHISPWQVMISHVVVLMLYLMMLMMPLSGWVMSSAGGHQTNLWGLTSMAMPGIPISEALNHLFFTIHHWLGYTLLAVVILHSLAALKHHFIDHDQVLQRMLYHRRSSSEGKVQEPLD